LIQYLKHHQINKQKWDLCIDSAYNSLIYANSWYLDSLNEGWEALILNDYQAVMPLTNGRKYGISYLFQPFFTQQLGVFSINEISETLVKEFVLAIPAKYRFADIHLNETNCFSSKKSELSIRKNYILDLSFSYDQLFKKFDDHTKRNVKKSANFILSIKPVSIEMATSFYRENNAHKIKKIHSIHYSNLEKALNLANSKEFLFIKGVYSEQNELLAVAVFVKFKSRITFLMGAVNETGKKHRAMYFIINSFISENASSNLLLDFEGSEISGVARFYQGFGSTLRPYFHLKINRLPWLLKLLK